MANGTGDPEKHIEYEQEIIDGILHIQNCGERADSAILSSFLQEHYSLTEDDAVHHIIEVLIAGKIESHLQHGREVLRVVSNQKRLLYTNIDYLTDHISPTEENRSTTDESRTSKDDSTPKPTQVMQHYHLQTKDGLCGRVHPALDIRFRRVVLSC